MNSYLELHHLGLATTDIKKSKEYLSHFFNITHISETIYDPNQKAHLCMLTMHDGTQIELIAGEVVKNYIKKRIMVYHSCYAVDDIHATINDFLKHDAMLISEPKEAILFQNKKVAFLMTELGLIELVEK